MNVWHFYARYFNFGDYALGVGMRNLFARHCKRAVIFKLFDVHDYRFTRDNFRKLNRTADCMLVGGGGLIHEFARNGRWLLHMPDRLIPKVQVPVVFYGLGYNAFPGQPCISGRVARNLSLWRQKALLFSVRNDGSQERLARAGIQAEEVPDPGFFVDEDYPRPSIDGEYAVIQLANDMKECRGFQNDTLLRNVAQCAEFLMKTGYKVLLAPHVPQDIAICDELLESMNHPSGMAKWDLHDLLRDEHTCKGLAFYKHARVVLSMRGHGQICPIGMGTPVVTIANHEKNLGLLERLKVDPLCVSVQDEHLGERLIECVREIEQNRDRVVSGYREAMARMTETAHRHLAALDATLAAAQTELRYVREKQKRGAIAAGKRYAGKALNVLGIR